jgi:hypothetical protein
MELERNLPQTLIERVDNHTNFELFRGWCKTSGTAYLPEMATTSLRYDNQHSEIVLGRGQQ